MWQRSFQLALLQTVRFHCYYGVIRGSVINTYMRSGLKGWLFFLSIISSSHHLHYHLNITIFKPCTISSCQKLLTQAAKLPWSNTALSVYHPQFQAHPAPSLKLHHNPLRSVLQPYKNPVPPATDPRKTEPGMAMVPLLGGLECWGYPDQTLHSG